MSSEDEWFAAACCWIRTEVCLAPLLFCDINGSLFHIDFHFSFEFDLGLWLRFMKGLYFGHRSFWCLLQWLLQEESKQMNEYLQFGMEIARTRFLYSCLQQLFGVLESPLTGTAGDAWLFVAKFDFVIYKNSRHWVSIERNEELKPDHKHDFMEIAYTISCSWMSKYVCADTFAIEMESLYLIKEYLPSCRCTLDVLSVTNLNRGLFLNWKCWSHCASPSRVVSNSLFSLPLRELMMLWLLKIVLLPMNDAGRF